MADAVEALRAFLDTAERDSRIRELLAPKASPDADYGAGYGAVMSEEDIEREGIAAQEREELRLATEEIEGRRKRGPPMESLTNCRQLLERLFLVSDVSGELVEALEVIDQLRKEGLPSPEARQAGDLVGKLRNIESEWTDRVTDSLYRRLLDSCLPQV